MNAEPTSSYSPLTLNRDWPKLGRLLFVVIACVIGVIMNSFFVACFFIEKSLKHVGFVYLACVGVADLMICSCVMPVVAVILLSGQWEEPIICYILLLFAQWSTYCYSLFFAMVASDSYYRLCRSKKAYKRFLSIPVSLVVFLIFGISFGTAAVGVYMSLDNDYCAREHFGNFYYRVATGVLLHAIPGVYTMFCLISSALTMDRHAKAHAYYRRSQRYENDRCTNNLNITAYITFVSFWIPHLYVVCVDPAASDSTYYNSVWLGIGRSVFTSFLYGILDKNFRHGFAYLFNYCCFKSTLSGSFAGRHQRAYEYPPPSDVRVHIMHQPRNPICSPQRPSASRETQEL